MLSLSAPSSSALPSSSSHGLPLPARPPPTAPSPGAAGIHSLRRGGAVGASDGRQGRSEVMRLSGGGWGASSDGLGERRESQRDARAKELEEAAATARVSSHPRPDLHPASLDVGDGPPSPRAQARYGFSRRVQSSQTLQELARQTAGAAPVQSRWPSWIPDIASIKSSHNLLSSQGPHVKVGRQPSVSFSVDERPSRSIPSRSRSANNVREGYDRSGPASRAPSRAPSRTPSRAASPSPSQGKQPAGQEVGQPGSGRPPSDSAEEQEARNLRNRVNAAWAATEVPPIGWIFDRISHLATMIPGPWHGGGNQSYIEVCGAQDLAIVEQENVTEVVEEEEQVQVPLTWGGRVFSFLKASVLCCFAPPVEHGKEPEGSREGEEEGKDTRAVGEINDELVEVVMGIVRRPEWEVILDKDKEGIKIWRALLEPDLSIAGRPLGNAAKFYAVKASGFLEMSPQMVHKSYFLDNSRVKEYNEFCNEIRDVESLDASTKLTWSASARIGPFKERDFVTRVHYRTLSDGTIVAASRAENSSHAPASDNYLRMEMCVGGNILQPVPGFPNRTLFTVLTHVNPGGIADSRMGAMIMNSQADKGPLRFIQSIRECILRDTAQAEERAEVLRQEEEFQRMLKEQTEIEAMKGNMARFNTCPAATV